MNCNFGLCCTCGKFQGTKISQISRQISVSRKYNHESASSVMLSGYIVQVFMKLKS